MITSSKHLHPYLKIVGVIILFGLTSGCALGRCVSWEEIPVTRSMCSTGSTHDGCGVSHATNMYTTFEKTCTARLPLDTEEVFVKAKNP